ncbi:serine protease inhibitor [Capsulimonas corticalis]|uniref:Serine protease inhibitor n=1 Tax=Capsulimonas corticalis TaxID=2219043 RepID=A0A402D3A8_9BACT|nr:serpin family protein [Capsulimonas corticalis]BDI28561.1 serine protease inhibitor [Capsulimonas corticalis]
MMKSAFARTLPFAAALTLAALAPAAAQSKPQVATAANAFGIDLLGKLIKAQPDDNCFISPYSVQQALLLADNGAGGITRKQIGTVLHLGTTPLATINAQAKSLRLSLASADPKVKISIANGLWADRSFKFGANYQETCRAFYAAQTQTVSLRQPSGAAAINAWAAQKTEGKIKTIVSPQDLESAVMVLTNALYFHGTWTDPFRAKDTEHQTFHLTPQKTEQTLTMTQMGMIDYAKTDDWEAVALPYGGGRLRMVVVLPSESQGLNAYVSSLTPDKWSVMAKRLRPTRLRLFLPKAHTEYGASLNPALGSLGMRQAFQSNADFSRIGSGVLISDIVHKTTLDIDEKGTTAAAVTAVIGTLSVAAPSPIIMRVDRPFFCAIQDTQTGVMLFAGVIRKPQAE